MPDLSYIFNNLRGAWLVLLGKREGLAVLDVTEEGFWRSFQAIPAALPALLLSWISYGRSLTEFSQLSVSSIAVRAACMDLAVWFIPMITFAAIARPLGMTRRFVHFVVANNWASALLSYVLLPVAMLNLLGPAFEDLALLVGLVIFALSLFLMFRLTHVVLDGAYQITATVFVLVTIASLLAALSLQAALGISYPAPPPG